MKNTKIKVLGICAAKGGVGKSTLTFMTAEKYHHAIILDADDATTTSLKQLAYRDPIKISFLDPTTKRIDRNAFNNMFESIAESGKSLIIIDMGASVSEQFPKYLSLNQATSIRELLESQHVELTIVCVIGGSNVFKASMQYLDEIQASVDRQFKIKAAVNGHYPMNETQKNIFESYCIDNEIEFFYFDLVHDKGEIALRTVENVLQNGKGLANLSPFKAIYFKKGLENLVL